MSNSVHSAWRSSPGRTKRCGDNLSAIAVSLLLGGIQPGRDLLTCLVPANAGVGQAHLGPGSEVKGLLPTEVAIAKPP
jgi:hypothetical protein